MNETTYIMEGSYGCGESKIRREIRKDHNDGRKPHGALKASEINALMQTWRSKPDWYRAWQETLS